VGESTVDGDTAPLFYAVLAGPVGAMVYRAINTLDSMFGHLDQRYQQFGWAAARVDDLANYLPARLTAPLVCVAAMVFGEKGMKTLESQVACGTLDTAGGLSTRAACHTAGQASSDAQRNREAMAGLAALDPPRITLHALRILARDGRKHASPNSGLAEAAMAGALGVQLGGVNYYGGEAMQRAKIGDPLLPLAARQIPRANTLMWTAAALFLVICLTARAGVVYCCHRAPHPVVSRGSVSIEQKTIVRVPLAACPPVSAGHGQASCPWHPCSLVMPSSPAVALPRGTSA
jgi:adenosylcobinamide-phosphate synthase